MIRLFTGLPGHGKTLRVVSMLQALDNARPLFVDGIRGLSVPHQQLDGKNWQAVPDGSVIVIDEAQRVFPTRGNSAPPEYVEALATHRHRGIDIWLITQHPSNIDPFVRRLIELHTHVVRVLGSESAMVYEWQELEPDPRSTSAIAAAIVTPWSYPKSAYAAYSSAVMHTVKRRIPVRIVVMFGLAVLAPVCAWWGWSLLGGVAPTAADLGQAVGEPSTTQAATAVTPITAEQWLAARRPRVPWRPDSAPIYDGQRAGAPPRLYCVDVEFSACRCYTEQMTRYAGVPTAECRTIARDGFYQPARSRS